MALKDVLDGAAGEMDAELVEFTANLRVAQACFVSDANHQLLDRFSSLWTAYLTDGWSSSIALTIKPSEERSRPDDRDQIFDSRSQWFSQTNKSSAFRWSDHDALGQSASEYLSFGFEVLNSIDELTLRGTEQCLEERREEVWHLSSMAVFRSAAADDTVFAPRRTLHAHDSPTGRSPVRKVWKLTSFKGLEEAKKCDSSPGFLRPELRRKPLKMATCARLRALYTGQQAGL